MTGAHAADSLAPLGAEPGPRAGESGGESPGDRPPVGDAPVVLRFAPLPEHVRTARLVAVALARRVGVEDGLLDEVRLAVGEACSRAVGLHRSVAPHVPVVVHLKDGRERFGVEVVDAVSGGPVPKPEDENAVDRLVGDGGFGDEGSADGADMGLAVLRGLVDDLEVELTSSGGVIRMGWPVAASRWGG
jgi:anti-sigma regulatory factor (Ser/Thr protein kinase)